jgi:hypothetical protein
MKQETEIPSRAARIRWPLIIGGLLATHVGAMMLAVQIASGDSGHAVLPDYYDKAVGWDDRRAEERESARLGWDVSIAPGAFADEDGRRPLRFVLRDRLGEPLEGATLTARVWHHAVGDAIDLAVEPGAEPGLYVARPPMARPGRWQCELTVERAGARFVESHVVDVRSPLDVPANAGGGAAGL